MWFTGRAKLRGGSAIRSHSHAAAALIPSPVQYAAAMSPLAEDASPLSTATMQAAMTGSTSNLKWSSAVRHAAEILVRRETATGKSGVCAVGSGHLDSIRALRRWWRAGLGFSSTAVEARFGEHADLASFYLVHLSHTPSQFPFPFSTSGVD